VLEWNNGGKYNMNIEDINLKQLIEQETGERFNRKGFTKCPFHSDQSPSLSVKYFSNTGKERYKCFACGASGDAIDLYNI
jgi:DNA primase (bacterial type)